MADVQQKDPNRPFRERSSPHWVDPQKGMNPATRFDLVAAVVGAIVLFGGLLFLVWQATQLLEPADPDLRVVEGSVEVVVESLDGGGCHWALSYTLENMTDAGPVNVVSVAVRPFRAGFRLSELSVVPSRPLTETGSGQVVYRVASCSTVSADPADFRLEVTYELAASLERTASLSLHG